jgi:hypothetical protein
VWVVVRGYDSVGDVTITLDTDGRSGTADRQETAKHRDRSKQLENMIEPLDFEAVCGALGLETGKDNQK